MKFGRFVTYAILISAIAFRHSKRWLLAAKTPNNKFLLDDLREGAVMEFRILAENAAGISEPTESSGLVEIKNPTYPPGTCQILICN